MKPKSKRKYKVLLLWTALKLKLSETSKSLKANKNEKNGL